MKAIDVLYLHVCTQNIFMHMPSYMHEEFASPDDVAMLPMFVYIMLIFAVSQSFSLCFSCCLSGTQQVPVKET